MPPLGPTPNDARHQVLTRLVGQIITDWAHTEGMLCFPFSALLRCNFDKGRIVLAGLLNFRAKRQLILRLGNSYLMDEDLPWFNAMMGRVKHLSEKRNLVAHRRPYHIGRGTFRYFNDDEPTQPNTFGTYTDVQTGNLRTWAKDIASLNHELLRSSETILHRPLLDNARLWTPPVDDQRP